MSPKEISLSCPTCDAKIKWSEKYPHRPFCSERCKLIDLGEWATEGHVIAGDSILDDDFDEDFYSDDDYSSTRQ